MSAIFDSILSEGFSVVPFLACLGAAGLCGLIAALIMGRSGEASKGFLISLVVLPMVVCTVILMVNGSVGTGIAVAGAFSLVRFRSVAGKAKDISAIFLVMTAGLSCAAGYVIIALLFTLLVGLVILLLSRFAFDKRDVQELHITIPETLQFAGAFEDVFSRYTVSHKLIRTRTTNMGSLYKLSYDVQLKESGVSQAFIDELRCRNGNLEILLTEKTEGNDTL